MTPTERRARTTAAESERWFAASGYLFVLCFLAMWKGKESEFVRFHARQAFLLFLSECVAFAIIIVIDQTVGRLPFLGFLIVVLVQILVYLTALFLSVMGFVKALFGEMWELPFFGPYRDRVPVI